MKQFTVQEVAMALGVDIQTLSNWLSRDGNQAYIDSHNGINLTHFERNVSSPQIADTNATSDTNDTNDTKRKDPWLASEAS